MLFLTVWTLLLVAGCGGSSEGDVVATESTPAAIEPRLPIPFEGGSRQRARLAKIQGMPAPELQLRATLNGRGLSIASLRGSVVLLDFWGVWCGPCKKLTPVMKELHRKYADQGLVVLGVHTDRDAHKVAGYVKQHNIEYPIGIEAQGNRTAAAYYVDGYPDLHLIDHEGTLRFADLNNAAPIEQLESAIEALLAERARDRGKRG